MAKDRKRRQRIGSGLQRVYDICIEMYYYIVLCSVYNIFRNVSFFGRSEIIFSVYILYRYNLVCNILYVGILGLPFYAFPIEFPSLSTLWNEFRFQHTCIRVNFTHMILLYGRYRRSRIQARLC